MMSICIIVGLAACGSDSSAKDQKESQLGHLKTSKYKLKETASYKGFNIKVNNVKYSDKLGLEYPDDGKKFAIINLTLENKSDVGLGYSEYNFKLKADNQESNVDIHPSDIKDLLSGGSLEKSKASVTGNLVGQVPKDATSIDLEFIAAYWNDKPVTFTLK